MPTASANGYTWNYVLNGTSPQTVTIGNSNVAGATVSGTAIGTTTDGVVIIPATLDGYAVTIIGNNSFQNCTAISSITMPDSLTSIGNNAFQSCTLTSFTIPNLVTSIGNQGFENCRNVTSITIPNLVATIGSRAFATCVRLTSINIPNSVTSIGTDAFIGTPPNAIIGFDKYLTITMNTKTFGGTTYNSPSSGQTFFGGSNVTFVRPTITMDISSNVANNATTNVKPITLKFTSSEATTTFSNDDISFNKGAFPYTLTTSDNKIYNATITDPGQGLNTFYVPDGVYTDAFQNNNTASNRFTFTYDSLPPMMDISSSTVANNAFTKISPIILTFTSTKATTTFSNDDISFNNGAFLYPLTTSDNKIYNATIETPIQGLNTFYVPAGAYTDSANQNNTASNRFTFTYDITPPTMEISSSNVANNARTNNTSMVLRFIPSEAIYDLSLIHI